MVTIRFFGLIRSNHRIETFETEPGVLSAIIDRIMAKHPEITRREFENAVLFINNEKIMHMKRFDLVLEDGDEVIFTNFVGGG